MKNLLLSSNRLLKSSGPKIKNQKSNKGHPSACVKLHSPLDPSQNSLQVFPVISGRIAGEAHKSSSIF